MEESIEALEKKYLLLDQGVSEIKIENIFNGYNNSSLQLSGYQTIIDEAIDDILEYNFRGADAIEYIDALVGEWGAEAHSKILEIHVNPNKRENFSTLNSSQELSCETGVCFK